MSARASEIARETAVYRCEECDQTMPVRKGVQIEDCPNCGCPSFQTALHIRGPNQMQSLSGIE